MDKDSPHVGNMIEKKLEELGMTKAEFGRRIGTSRQNVNPLLRKTSIDTAFLFRIGKALNHDFFRDLAESPVIHGKGISPKSNEVLLATAEVQASVAKLNLLLLQGH